MLTLIIVLLPLIGFLSGSLFGRYLGKMVCVTTTTSVVSSLLLSLYLFYDIISTGVSYEPSACPWLFVKSLDFSGFFCSDGLISVMLIVITFFSSLLHLYSIVYMEHDPRLPRLMSYLSLFTFFMLISITANIFLQMFVGY